MWRRLLVLTGLAALAAWLLRRRTPVEPYVEGRLDAFSTDPAEELRRKLDETRGRASDEEAPAPAAGDLDGRRREVHDRARAAADEMRGSSE